MQGLCKLVQDSEIRNTVSIFQHFNLEYFKINLALGEGFIRSVKSPPFSGVKVRIKSNSE